MGHAALVEEQTVDPRPYVPEGQAGIQHQARCTECDWTGPVRTDPDNSEHEARADAEQHEQET
jgi:hypothetical protein